MVTLQQRLYPGNEQEARRWTAGVEPDLLGEHLVGQEADDELLDGLLEIADADEVRQSLTILTRIAARSSTHQDLFAGLLTRRLEQLAEPSLAVAVETGDPIGKLLAEAIEAGGDVDLAKRLEPQMPVTTLALREVNVAVEQKLLAHQRTKANDEAGLKELARLANNLGVSLSDLGRREAALDATQEAVDILRRLAAERPDAFLPVLATSTYNLSDRLAELERDDEALAAAHEAVIILAPFFLALPAAHAHRMSYMVDDYLARAAAVGQDPDSDLVDPIRQALAQLGD